MFLFFKIKGRSTAALYKKKNHSYITRQSEHHHKQRTQTTHNKTLHNHNLGKQPKEATRELRRHQRCATPKIAARCRPERQLKLLHHGTITLKPLHTIVDPPAPVMFRQNTPVAALIENTDPGHSAWWPRLTHRLALLCQGLRYLKPL